MSLLLGILLFLLFSALLSLMLWQNIQRRKIRERVLYGFNVAEEQVETDLSAGHYGLKGTPLFFYYLREYLATPAGRAMIFLTGLLAAGVPAMLAGKPPREYWLIAVSSGALMFVLSFLLLHVYKKEQLRKVQMELPNALETLAAVMESGSAFESALSHLLSESDPEHPLYMDLNIMNEAMQRGRSRSEALRLWASRCDLVYVGDVVSGMIQVDQTGGSLGAVMKHHAQALMRENEAAIQRRAERLPIRMLMPMVTMILPAVIAIAAGPSMLRIFQIIEQIIASGGPLR